MSDNWATPKEIKRMFKDWFDPCPLNDNPDINGLSIDWHDKTFVNPPYSKPLLWVIKAIHESKQNKRIVMLLKADTSTKVYQLLHENKSTIMWCSKRLKFNNGRSPATFPSMLVFI